MATNTSPTIRERGLVFTSDNVRAIRYDAKTQTRRIIGDDWWRCLDPEDPEDLKRAVLQCPYGQPGDILYVREAYRTECTIMNVRGVLTDGITFRYRATPAYTVGFLPRNELPSGYHWPQHLERWQPARFMPKLASRLRLEIARVRIQRIQQISKVDQRAEGYGYIWGGDCKCLTFTIRWNETNGHRGSWFSNPWVFALTFRRLKT